MNVFDSLLVLISCIDLYILTPLIQTSLNNTATLRLLRTIKLVRHSAEGHMGWLRMQPRERASSRCRCVPSESYEHFGFSEVARIFRTSNQ